MIIDKTIEITRFAGNPIITPKDIKPSFPDWEVLGAFNAGVAQHGDETILLVRVAERPVQADPRKALVPVLNCDRVEGHADMPVMRTIELDRNDSELDFSDPRVIRDLEGNTLYLTSISHLRVARSRDGVSFEIDERPTVLPEGPMERWGIEDPRITDLNGKYYIAYSAVSDKGVAVGMMTTEDFVSFRREGMILAPTNKDVAFFPETIGGSYYMLHRPVPEGLGEPEMWIASSPDLKHWGGHRFLMGLRSKKWDDTRIGAGCVPIKTEDGWLILYHGADRDNRYCLGAALLDLQDPGRVIARMDEPFMTPEADYETSGFFQNVIFACGTVVNVGQAIMYYGAADDSIACVSFELEPLMSLLRRSEQRGAARS
ncbi:glycoside hydrolase family 130 protein [Paenibacillus sp. LHD-117]|uniref:glycoside hydrolase family 130 protein n=1 Tax=Paenibacillus sp. LHD-117 TaxID=3071412 RepID=UPI0027E04F1C|nr:glycoside hydrolase family 130 protein [Paenibacillus sp. LHD-117]MDQ6420344.1 glycoside hydrolase family 130 protein [Paenibacillus sp. LHD-117]